MLIQNGYVYKFFVWQKKAWLRSRPFSFFNLVKDFIKTTQPASIQGAPRLNFF